MKIRSLNLLTPALLLFPMAMATQPELHVPVRFTETYEDRGSRLSIEVDQQVTPSGMEVGSVKIRVNDGELIDVGGFEGILFKISLHSVVGRHRLVLIEGESEPREALWMITYDVSGRRIDGEVVKLPHAYLQIAVFAEGYCTKLVFRDPQLRDMQSEITSSLLPMKSAS